MCQLKIEKGIIQLDKYKSLDNINITINKGDLLFVTGESGSGKSTLLRVIAALTNMSEGNLYLDNKEYSDYTPIKLRESIRYISQDPSLFGKKVIENFEFVYKLKHKPVDYNRIENLLNKFNLSKDYLNKDIDSLSGGEKQRIAIIRGILILPEVLLLDEITSALDEVNKINVENIIKEINGMGVTVLWITHDLNQLSRVSNKYFSVNKEITLEEVK